jgi:site-specific DNA-cytosine methylase
VLEEFESDRLKFLHCSDSDVPRLALIAGPPSPFRLNAKNELMPSVDEFSRPLELAAAAAKSKLKPHFVVLMTHSAVLHQNTIGRFSAIVFDLLERNYSVHLRLTNLQEHGLPQDKSILVMVAAPASTSLAWHLNWALPDSQLPCKVKDFIGDIVFGNPRASTETKDGFVCSYPAPNNNYGVPNHNGESLLYNHQTGRVSETEMASLDMDAHTVTLDPYRAMPLVHPGKTVRSPFRLQLTLRLSQSEGIS